MGFRMSKGSDDRTKDRKSYGENFDRIFSKKKPKRETKVTIPEFSIVMPGFPTMQEIDKAIYKYIKAKAHYKMETKDV